MMALDLLWGPPPADLALSSDDVHVWRASLDQPAWRLERLAQMLSADERAKAERFYFERDRKRFIVSQGLLRTILSRYLTIEPNQLQFCYGRRGKPALAQMFGGGTLRFNMSHSHGLALYAIARDRKIGVDLERIRPILDAEQIAERFFSAQENAIFCVLPPSQKLKAFFNCWTRKEAYLKATGDGLARPLDQFNVSLAPGESARLLHVEGDPQEAARWSLQALTPAPGYVAALAVEGHGWRLACWQWPEYMDAVADALGCPPQAGESPAHLGEALHQV
jgi:4'-phosphopantetheinyl transferase